MFLKASPPSDPVSPVKSVDSVSSSSDWCNLTVSCRAQNSHINSTFRCLNHTCSQEEGERPQVTPSAADLHVYLSNGSIICNYSNQYDFYLIKNQKSLIITLEGLSCLRHTPVYTAVVSEDTEQQITGYKITVQDPVSPVKLSVDSVSSSSDWCNLTVSCRAQDSHINSTFRCDTHTCSQEGGERPQVTPSAELHVHVSNGSIICNHSNQVSWKKDMKTIEKCLPTCCS
ncbi:uncharacterized protein LOC144526659 [Sander vitreus]